MCVWGVCVRVCVCVCVCVRERERERERAREDFHSLESQLPIVYKIQNWGPGTVM